MPTVTAQIATATDDGSFWESGGNWYFNNSSDYNTVGEWTGQEFFCYFRFVLNVPRSSIINAATMNVYSQGQISASVSETNALTVSINANAADNASTCTSPSDAIGRTRTTNYALWSVPAFSHDSSTNPWNSGVLYTTGDFSSVVQEIVNRPGWSSGNHILLFVNDIGSNPSGYRSMNSYETNSSLYIPSLSVTYTSVTPISSTGTASGSSSGVGSGGCFSKSAASGSATSSAAANTAVQFNAIGTASASSLALASTLVSRNAVGTAAGNSSAVGVGTGLINTTGNAVASSAAGAVGRANESYTEIGSGGSSGGDGAVFSVGYAPLITLTGSADSGEAWTPTYFVASGGADGGGYILSSYSLLVGTGGSLGGGEAVLPVLYRYNNDPTSDSQVIVPVSGTADCSYVANSNTYNPNNLRGLFGLMIPVVNAATSTDYEKCQIIFRYSGDTDVRHPDCPD